MKYKLFEATTNRFSPVGYVIWSRYNSCSDSYRCGHTFSRSTYAFFSALVSPADKTRFSWRIKLEPKKRTDALAGNHTSDVNKGNMAFQDWQLLPSCKSAKFLSLQVHNDKTTIPTKIVLGNYFEKHAVFLSYYGKLDFQSFHDEDCRMLAVS